MSAKLKKPELPKIENGAARLAPDTPLLFEIEKRAYNIWLSNGCRHGEHVSHWLQAENELLAERQNSASKHL
jgi:Protein of unknown function (DUF2934)